MMCRSCLDTTVRHCGGWGTTRGKDGKTQQEAFHDWYMNILKERPQVAPATAATATNMLKGTAKASAAAAVEVTGNADLLPADGQ